MSAVAVDDRIFGVNFTKKKDAMTLYFTYPSELPKKSGGCSTSFQLPELATLSFRIILIEMLYSLSTAVGVNDRS